MPVPRFCTNPGCPNSRFPAKHWFVRIGSYHTIAHGTVRRYRCRTCGRSVSDQTESIHYYAKRRLPMKAMVASLTGGSSQREIGRRYGVSPAAVGNGMLRLGRQSMAAQIHLLNEINERHEIVFDGLRSFVTSQDYPCDITTVVDRAGEVILTMTHAVRGRGGRLRPAQAERLARKRARWRPARGTCRRAIALVVRELWDYVRPLAGKIALVDTDEDLLYQAVLSSCLIWRHLISWPLVQHRRTPSTAPRTYTNPLFPVNYIDRLLRHRLKEHTRETIAFGRHSTMQMHRAWIFAWDHNMCREYRVKHPELGVHAEQGVIASSVIRRVKREFFERRIRITGCRVPESIRQVWRNQLPTPPVRWRAGQQGTMVRIPKFALRDLAAGHLSWEAVSG